MTAQPPASANRRGGSLVHRLIAGVLVTSLTAALSVLMATAASAAPTFKMPFPCGQTWVANNDNSSAHVAEELDFNRGSTAADDRGDTVVATAAGTVKTAKNQGTVNGYGNLVTIDHGGGWVSYYAHLETLAVVSGQAVLQGQPIGSVGNSSYRNITPHLHFEIRLGAGYPGNIRAVPGYSYAKGGSQSMKSNNCATKQDPAALCGSGYVVNDTAKLGSVGAVVLTYNKAAKNNCAVTLKFGNLGSRTATSVYITPQGQSKKSDSGNFFEYAGPVRTNSPTCIKWGGAIGGSSYNSRSEHC
ncbi:M23 family metallopeptidase [Nakamurella sp. GG22]